MISSAFEDHLMIAKLCLLSHVFNFGVACKSFSLSRTFSVWVQLIVAIPFTLGHVIRQLVVLLVQDSEIGVQLDNGPETSSFQGWAENPKRCFHIHHKISYFQLI